MTATACTYYGPFDVTDQRTWQAALNGEGVNGDIVGTASKLTSIQVGTKLWFVEIKNFTS